MNQLDIELYRYTVEKFGLYGWTPKVNKRVELKEFRETAYLDFENQISMYSSQRMWDDVEASIRKGILENFDTPHVLLRILEGNWRYYQKKGKYLQASLWLLISNAYSGKLGEKHLQNALKSLSGSNYHFEAFLLGMTLLKRIVERVSKLERVSRDSSTIVYIDELVDRIYCHAKSIKLKFADIPPVMIHAIRKVVSLLSEEDRKIVLSNSWDNLIQFNPKIALVGAGSVLRHIGSHENTSNANIVSVIDQQGFGDRWNGISIRDYKSACFGEPELYVITSLSFDDQMRMSLKSVVDKQCPMVNIFDAKGLELILEEISSGKN
ncbi:MAG: hypothetical protein MI748_00265 [Opitutales bacterium]|nr:hypothetical protein [Opitutales bacterium]